ncbi:two-component sensor histidine kinase [Povalibacter uvarum]|uniref:histidine kinase n=1 Tax=Povalibacter uvarum TaxID=732238 RepID=A0A841HN23_9GAMM|nr:CHASE3 domain-containing protein [Povalibacter uvarum]MBB6093568.1 two-component sensor histidine kinase [Povalibacter uvarum]
MQELGKKATRISRALVVTVVLCFLMLLVSTVVLVGMSRTAVRTDEWIAHTLDVKQALDVLLTTIGDAEAGQRGYLITGQAQFLVDFRAAHDSVPALVQKLRGLVAEDPVQLARVDALTPAIDRRFEAIRETLDLVATNDRAQIARIVSTRGAAAMREIRERISQMDASENRLLLERRRQAAVIRDQFVRAVSAMVIVAGIFAVMALLSVRAYMQGLDQSQRRLAAHHAELEAKVAERTAELSRSTELAERERGRAEALLTDVNHRVGNNLALVSSFLTMQQRAVTSPEAVKALSAARARVQAVASAHRKLRLGADFATVRADEVLGAVLDDICAGFPADGRIQVRYELSPLEIHARDAVSLGVLTSELVMNAVKHGFRGDDSGEVRVVFSGQGEAPFLEVIDDGVGYESNNNSQGSDRSTGTDGGGLGTRIIDMVARQFGSQSQKSPARDDAHRPGTRVRVDLPRLQLMQQA